MSYHHLPLFLSFSVSRRRSIRRKAPLSRVQHRGFFTEPRLYCETGLISLHKHRVVYRLENIDGNWRLRKKNISFNSANEKKWICPSDM
ncbi:hypothetical protein AtEden1_Chr1g0076431 [Arabidopsis thaliana]